MKFRVALVTLLVAGLAASLAVAAPATSPKKSEGTDTRTTDTRTTGHPMPPPPCHIRLLVLTGTLVSVADDQLSFEMLVKHTNKHARAYRGWTITVKVDVNTKIRRLGKRVTLGDLKLGDRLVVQSRACKKGTNMPPLLAARVVAKPAKPAPTTTS